MPKETYTMKNLAAMLKELAVMQNENPYAIDSLLGDYNQASEMVFV